MKLPKPFKNLWAMIKKSCEKNDDVSSTRLTSYIITACIIMFVFYFLFMAIWIGVTGTGTIPNETLIVFGALLSHQLILLGVNKSHETKQKVGQLPPMPEQPTE